MELEIILFNEINQAQKILCLLILCTEFRLIIIIIIIWHDCSGELWGEGTSRRGNGKEEGDGGLL
jgi:hypothetical protein